MISRFFASPLFRRLLCCFLALATVCLCLAPALVQPAYALAGVDDATLAIGLLFCSWAGVTFATNQGAATAVTSFLNSSVNGLKACSEVASKYVVDGSLALVQGVKDAFQSILPDINSTFRTPEGSTEGSLFGSTPLGVPLPLSSFDSVPDSSLLGSLPSYPVDLLSGDSNCLTVSTSKGVYSISPSFLTSYPAKIGCVLIDPTGDSRSYYSNSILDSCTFSSFTPFFVGNDFYVSASYTAGKYDRFSSWRIYSFPDVQDASFKFLDTEDQVPFKRSKEIDGTQIQEITFAPGGVWEPSPDDPTQPDMSQWPGLSLAALLAILANQNSNDPNLDPEKLIEGLRQALRGSGGGGGSSVTDPTTPPTDPGSSGDVTDAPPEFNNMMLPGLKDFFPFCIPFDIYNMMGALCADPVAPKFTFATSFLGQVYSVDIDLSAWDNVAVVVRYMVVAIYIVALAVATRKFIKW